MVYVRPSVCLSQHGPTAANALLQVCYCAPNGQEISIDCCSGCMRAVTRDMATSVFGYNNGDFIVKRGWGKIEVEGQQNWGGR